MPDDLGQPPAGQRPGWDPGLPYNDLPSPPHVERLETRAVLKAVIRARAHLAVLDRSARLLPNPAILINAIPLLEAQASSAIENIVTTTDLLFRHAVNEDAADPATKEALRYRTALRAGFERVRARGLTSAVAVEICTAVKGYQVQVRAVPGTRIGNPTTGEVSYSPPEGPEVIAAKLAEWEQFIHRDDGMDPLVRMAAAHYQFEAIHPFTDGNGRTGRIINILMLVEAGLLEQPVLYLSEYFIRTRQEYYRRLLAVTADQAWGEWIEYVLQGVAESAQRTSLKIDRIRDLMVDFDRSARAVSRAAGGGVLQSVLFEQPYCRIGTVMDRCEVSRPTATAWLDSLVKAGLLTDSRVGRERIFLNHALLEVLNRR
jgi:Fic family protein